MEIATGSAVTVVSHAAALVASPRGRHQVAGQVDRRYRAVRPDEPGEFSGFLPGPAAGVEQALAATDIQGRTGGAADPLDPGQRASSAHANDAK